MDVQVDAALHHDAVGGHWQPHDASPGTLGGGGSSGGSAWDFGHLLSHPEDEHGGGRQDSGAHHEAMAGTLDPSRDVAAARLLDHRDAGLGVDHYDIYDGAQAQAAAQQVASQFGGSPSEWGPSHFVGGGSVSTGDGVRTEELESEWQLEELLGHIDALEGLLCVWVSVCAEVVGTVDPGRVRSAYRCAYSDAGARSTCRGRGAPVICTLTEVYTQLSCATPRRG